MVGAEDAISLYRRLSAQGIQIWVTGGWGIDALLGEQTRPHKDLDVIMLLDDVVRMRELLGHDGYSLKELWSENRWAIDAQGIKAATAFVLRDLDGGELDAHAMRLDELGHGIPAWEKPEGFIFTPQDLSGVGTIASCMVRCMSAENQMICHTGYELPDYQWRDLEHLHQKFGVEILEEKPNKLSRPQGLTGREG
jgi:lincosamide nucleotidyltransferase A/C/D/E